MWLGEGNGAPLQYSWLENPMDGGAWWAIVHGVAKSRTQLSDFTFTFHFHALEKEMATHSSVLAWRIPGMGEPGGLLSMGSHRVRHDWNDLVAAARMWLGFPGGSVGRESAWNTGDTGEVGSIPSLGKSLGEGMATHSSILAWRTPWTEEPGWLQSMGSQRVRYNWSDWAHRHARIWLKGTMSWRKASLCKDTI